MKTILLIIAAIICFILLASPRITLKPFSFELRDWIYATGFVLIVIGVGLIRYEARSQGKIQMLEELIEEVSINKNIER